MNERGETLTTSLIDADVLRYECGAVGQKFNKDTGEVDILPFDFVKEVFDERIRTILVGCGATDYKLFITADRGTARIAKRCGLLEGEFHPNFREAIAVGKTYKGTRKQDRPFHWINLTAYVLSHGRERVEIAVGCEADDLIAISHYGNQSDSIICTRDKDLRQIPGNHYGWECGKQPEFGPITYDSVGKIELVRGKSGNKIVGGGFAFFCAQLLTGDVVDNIGGAKGIGPVKACEILEGCLTERDYFNAVRRTFEELDSERWKELLEEQCHLLWIVRERNPDGSLKYFNLEEWLDG